MSKTVLFNAKIYVDRGDFREAVLYEDGIIKGVGTNEEILSVAAGAEKIDAQGRTVIPGLNDSHMHLLMVGEVLSEAPIGDSSSIEDMVERCKKFATDHPQLVEKGMHSQGWNQDLFEKGKVRLPNRHDLDKISTEYPIVLERVCGHTCAVNTKALELLGIEKGTPQIYEGGTIEFDEDGAPSGYFTENAVYEVRKIVPQATIEEQKGFLLKAMNYASEHGLTSVQANDLGVMTENMDATFEMYREVYREKKAPLRFRHQVCFLTIESFKKFLDGEFKNRDKYDNMLALGPLKLFKDGSLGARTATMRNEYLDDSGNFGVEALSDELMDQLVQLAAENGMQTVTHVIGDDAIEKTNASYEKVLKDGKNVLRNSLIHCQITDTPLLERIKKSDTLIAYQPIFLQCDMYAVESRCGKDLSSTSYAMKTAIDMGIHASYGTDSPVEDCNPFPNIYVAVNRKDLKGKPAEGFYKQECVDVYEAIDAYTVESAYHEFQENIKGRIKPGYYADMVVLDKDIFTIDTMDIINVLPVMTIVDGKVVYKR
ncbi:MAG: amidohydrolase [Clostridia bacterium]|nr:amidohydrolase [Clostridia bacterium]